MGFLCLLFAAGGVVSLVMGLLIPEIWTTAFGIIALMLCASFARTARRSKHRERVKRA